MCPDLGGTRIAPTEGMYLTLDREQTQVMREILDSALKELRIESARADAHDYRERLHERERIVESVLARLGGDEDARASIY